MVIIERPSSEILASISRVMIKYYARYDYYARDASGTKVKRTENWRNLVLMREPEGKYQKLL